MTVVIIMHKVHLCAELETELEFYDGIICLKKASSMAVSGNVFQQSADGRRFFPQALSVSPRQNGCSGLKDEINKINSAVQSKLRRFAWCLVNERWSTRRISDQHPPPHSTLCILKAVLCEPCPLLNWRIGPLIS